MMQTFTVRDVQHKRISSSKGAMSWWLNDGEGTSRRVNAVSDIVANGIIGEVRAVYERESALVEHLQYVEKGETFSMDFSSHNQQKNYAPRKVYNKTPGKNSFDKFASGVGRFAAVAAGLLLVLSLTYGVFIDTVQVPSNLASIID